MDTDEWLKGRKRQTKDAVTELQEWFDEKEGLIKLDRSDTQEERKIKLSELQKEKNQINAAFIQVAEGAWKNGNETAINMTAYGPSPVCSAKVKQVTFTDYEPNIKKIK